MRPCVIVPAYENERTVAAVARGAAALGLPVIVVDDGSRDRTAEAAREIDGVTVLRHERNQGKGAALRSGFLAAAERGFTHALTIDADGQHLPEDIPRLLEAARAEPAALILGARDLAAAGAGRGSRFGRAFSNFWTLVETGLRLEDTQSGFRLYPLGALAALRLEASGYDFEIEALVKAAWSGVPVRSVPVRARYFQGAERVSHFRPFLDFARISRLNTRLVTLRICLPRACLAALFRRDLAHLSWPRRLWRGLALARGRARRRVPLPFLLLPAGTGLVLAAAALQGAARVVSFAGALGLLAGAAAILAFLFRRAELFLAAFLPAAVGLLLALGVAGFLGGVSPGPAAGAALAAALALEAAALLLAYLRRFRGQKDRVALVAWSVPVTAALAALAWRAGLGPPWPQGWPALVAGTCGVLLLSPFCCRAVLVRAGPNGTPAPANMLAALRVFWLMLAGGARHFLARAPGANRRAAQRAAVDRIQAIARAIQQGVPLGRRVFLGLERIPRGQPCVVVANHESMYDIMAALALPLPLRILAKRWVWRMPVLGAMVRAAGYILVEEDRTEALFEQAARSLAEGVSLLVFPEGTRSRSGRMGRFHNGAFAIARRCGVPVLPVAMVNTRETVPPGTWWVGEHDARIVVLEAMDPGAFSGEGADRRMARAARERIAACCRDLWLETQYGPVWHRILSGMYRCRGLRANAAARGIRSDPFLHALPRLCAGNGRVLILGCGFGLSAARLALAYPAREIIAVGPPGRALRAARAALGDRFPVAFVAADPAACEAPPAQWTILDVLALRQEAFPALLRRVAGVAAPGARLLLRGRQGDCERALAECGFAVDEERGDLCRAGEVVLLCTPRAFSPSGGTSRCG
ncbi:MAG: glycosyltransferase [Planctomycetes bacterium]|nr:glycosyltransferase [Planctomycetota bacterium]